MDGKKWHIVDTVVGIAGGILGIVGIITGIKSANYEEEAMYKELEDRYGLTPKTEETE